MLPADLAAKLQQCATNDFAGPRDYWFNWLAHFTTMVAVGLVFELPELAYELRLIAREWIPYFRYRIVTRPHREHIAKVLAFVGWILIVAGVAGERVAEVKVKDFDARIQECSDAKVAKAILDAGDAAASATTARQEADALQTKADALNKQLDRVKAEAEAAQGKIATVSQQADETDERLKLALSMLSVRSVRNLKDITDKLKQWKWPQNVAFKSYSGDSEAFNICVELALAMESAKTGSTVKLECGSESLTMPPWVVQGIAISWSDPLVIFPMHEILLDDGGLGKLADITGCSPSCRGPSLEDASEMEVFVGLNPGFSLSRFEQEEKALKQHKDTPSKPNL